MAGLFKVADGCALDCFKTLQKLCSNDFWVDLEPGRKEYFKACENDEIKCLFNQLLSVFLSEICGSQFLRPLPPMLGNGQAVDLFKLYLVVREKGGYEAVSDNRLWDSVAKESGVDSGLGPSLKLIYAKYLHKMDKWMRRSVGDKERKCGLEDSETTQSVLMMDLESESKVFCSENSDPKKNDGEHLHMDLEESKSNFTSNGKLDKDGKDWSFVELEEGKGNGSDTLCESSVVGEGGGSIRKKCKDDEVQSSVQLDTNTKTGTDKCGMDLGSQIKEDGHSRKRKRDCDLALLDWVTKVAKDPCDPAIGSLPERSKWKAFGNDLLWRQVLLVRQAMLVKRNTDSSEQSIWQRKQKMHPSMYEDHSGFESARCSRRILSAKISRAGLSSKKSQARSCSESTSSDDSDEPDKHSVDPLNGLWIKNYARKRIPVGQYFQVEVPEWTEESYETDSKWLGTRVWPQEKGVNSNSVIERDRIGFGRRDTCGCEFQGSSECVRFHVSEKRNRLKLELGMAFFHWHIDKMGEEVARSWAKAEKNKFEVIVKSNPSSEDKLFWDEICRLFPYKRREELVSYYFNVFLLHRRGQQNRFTPREIDSDDEPDFGSTTNCSGKGAITSPISIYCSPKKTHTIFRECSKMD